ncbi:Nitronate monooxygenase [Pseudomonas moorei]|uniref:Nitronate monooxygenase n=1 Tax=Pseudomonas moorei TaxID=395599 RepID=A0A1H1FZD6_9PSED|nr:Nitronate monooxygenase [Pseudomonas moorei]
MLPGTVEAPGGGPSSVELVSSVSNAGGLGSFGMQSLEPHQMIEVVRQIRQATSKPFAINLWMSNAQESAPSPADARQAGALLRPYLCSIDDLDQSFHRSPGQKPDEPDDPRDESRRLAHRALSCPGLVHGQPREAGGRAGPRGFRFVVYRAIRRADSSRQCAGIDGRTRQGNAEGFMQGLFA